jgi:hypothetical protein
MLVRKGSDAVVQVKPFMEPSRVGLFFDTDLDATHAEIRLLS